MKLKQLTAVLLSTVLLLCQKYDKLFSKSDEDSDISRINNAGGEPVEVSEDTITLIKKGIYYSELSDGAFDITIGAVSNLWDFKSGEHNVPDKAKVKEAASHVNYKNISIQNNTVQLSDSKAAIDVGAIAKGYIADRLKDYLKDEGVKIYAARLDGSNEYYRENYCGPCAVMIGNEGNGLTDKLSSCADKYIRIPMEGSLESLNAAVSASVIMYEAARQRHEKTL